MNLIEIIKSAAEDAVQAGNPVNILHGTVTDVAPLVINVDQRFTLTEEFLILTDSVQELFITIAGVKYQIRQGLQPGDKVLMMRVQGGQQYVVLDRVV
ncbi:DUF2577 domain-containing protein [Paenibacillus thiaminolyticus]|uniref:DUF2577 domain-containing protein n=1 Tax=Paenibacillus thiaminolyticus TaxID=49283 RepID=UPI0011658B11|nr:DUF2577 domain-containing protein [Paenibacillus thiaminolyticus]NGP58145.1 DUF2577 domain-containing protein [Paenibacillus thiaminolyticus]